MFDASITTSGITDTLLWYCPCFLEVLFFIAELDTTNFDRPIRNVGERLHFPCCTIPVALLLVALVELLVASSSELLLLRQPKLFRQESEYV